MCIFWQKIYQIKIIFRNKIIFQQDSVGPHNTRIVTDFLNQQFSACCIGQYTDQQDFDPLNFFLWEYCKEIIYRHFPENVEELNNNYKLHDAIWFIDNDVVKVIERMQANLLRRIKACVTMDGGYFEHLL